MVLQAKPPARWKYMEEAERKKAEGQQGKEAAND